MLKKNFEAFTQLKAIKKNAILLCGQDFIKTLTQKRLYAKDDEFWQEVNTKLSIPQDAYQQKLHREQEEQERQKAEKEAREKAEREELFKSKKPVFSKIRGEWEITVFELPNSPIYGKKFIARYSKNLEITLFTDYSTWYSNSSKEAYDRACSSIDQLERKLQEEIAFQELYQVLKPLYLILIFLSGWNKYIDIPQKILNPELDNSVEKDGKENFLGVEFWNGLDFDILNRLKAEELLEFSSTRKSLYINKKAIKEARNVLKTLNLEGLENFLKKLKIHEEYLNYKNYYERQEEE
jgi:hypothetical protein